MRIFNKNMTTEELIFTTLNTTFLVGLAIVALYPFVNTIALSFNDGLDTVRGGIYLWPRKFSLYNYRTVFLNHTIYQAAFVSVARTVIATILGVFFTTMLAYTLSRREYVFRNPITIIFILTMYFNAGLIPTYFLYRSLGLINNFLVYVVPSMISAFNLIVIRTYIGSIPESLIESSKIDGAGDFRIFWQIIFPLCKPVLATIALFVAVGSWNSWLDSFIFTTRQSLSTLQYELMKLVAIANVSNSNSALMADAMASAGEAGKNYVNPISMRAAVTVVAATPIILLYPFLQKHFVVGLTVGGVKG